MDRLKPLNDFIFKKIFEDINILKGFLNSVLDRTDNDKLITLEIIDNKEITRDIVDDKTAILDVRAKTIDGTQIDIEVQLSNQRNMEKRTMWYWGRAYNEGIKKGGDYSKLSKVITINILDFEYIPLNKYHSQFHLWEDEEKECMLTDIVEIHFIEMPKFLKLEHKDLKGNRLQRWMAFFNKDISKKELEEVIEMDQDIRKAEEKLEYLSSDENTIALYKKREESLHERANLIYTGRMEGIEEAKIKNAKNLLDLLPDEVIAERLELPIEKVRELRKELSN